MKLGVISSGISLLIMCLAGCDEIPARPVSVGSGLPMTLSPATSDHDLLCIISPERSLLSNAPAYAREAARRFCRHLSVPPSLYTTHEERNVILEIRSCSATAIYTLKDTQGYIIEANDNVCERSSKLIVSRTSIQSAPFVLSLNSN